MVGMLSCRVVADFSLPRERGQDDGPDRGKRGQQDEHSLRRPAGPECADFATDEIAERASSVPESGDDTDETVRRAADQEREAERGDEQLCKNEERQGCCEPRHTDATGPQSSRKEDRETKCRSDESQRDESACTDDPFESRKECELYRCEQQDKDRREGKEPRDRNLESVDHSVDSVSAPE